MAAVLFLVVELLPLDIWFAYPTSLYVEFGLFLVPYLIAGYDVIAKAARNIVHGQMLDENFLMCIATIGAFALVLFPNTDPHMAEGAAVMIFYQIGEWFERYAVGRSRKSISAMMDIAPEFANVMRDGRLVQVDPREVAIGETVVVKPGERIPVDGTVLEGTSQLDTAALTGESLPRTIAPGSNTPSGCINLSGAITLQADRAYEDSTVARILDLVENASEKKARTENFITRFARYYTPIVVGAAVLLAVAPPLLLGQSWSPWIERGLIFLVVSCPCALVISVPLSFFGGIGGASRAGILVKGGNYLEALAQVDTIAFDKTGTLTNGSFDVVAVHAQDGIDPQRVLSLAAHAESYSSHPIAQSILAAYSGDISTDIVQDVSEVSGQGISATVDNHAVLAGNGKLLAGKDVEFENCDIAGTVVHVACNGQHVGHIIIADVMKDDAAKAIGDLHAAGVKRTIMLTGDRAEVARAVADDLGIDEYRAELLPQDKVFAVEEIIADNSKENDPSHHGKVAFVGDGINDAPVLMRADVGIAMGGMGSDAAIEAADIVLMDDRPSAIAKAIRIARKTMRIVWQNIVFALGVKFAVLILAALGFANMWLAVFADVGVACLAILNAMRAMRISRL